MRRPDYVPRGGHYVPIVRHRERRRPLWGWLLLALALAAAVTVILLAFSHLQREQAAGWPPHHPMVTPTTYGPPPCPGMLGCIQ